MARSNNPNTGIRGNSGLPHHHPRRLAWRCYNATRPHRDRIELLFAGCISTRLALTSRFLRALFQFGKRTASEATEFSRSRVELLSVIGAARLECGEPAAESGELIGRQLGDNFGDFFDFHVAQYSTAGAWVSDGKVAADRL